MKASIRLLAGLLFSIPVLAHAAAVTPPGVNLRWDDCFGDGGVWNRSFACDTNSGSERLVLSFELDTPMADVSGQEIVVDLASASATLPAWWEFRNSGTCRLAASSLIMVPPATAVNCVDWAGGMAAGGIGAYRMGGQAPNGPNSARFIIAVAVPAQSVAALNAGQEYYSATLVLSHAKTVGTDACSGCDVPMCIFYQSLKLATPVSANDRTFYHGANTVGSQMAQWQNGYTTNLTLSCSQTNPVLGCRWSFGCVPFDVTRSSPSTWGEVKSLYR